MRGSTTIVAFSGIGDFIDTAVKFYSSGMYVRLAFAVAVHTDPDILLVDEVLAVGDEAFQRKCMERIAQFREEGRTIILVSHSAQQVAELCDRGIVLSDGQVVFDGDTNEAIGALRDVLDGRRVGEAAPEETVHPIQVKRIELLDDERRSHERASTRAIPSPSGCMSTRCVRSSAGRSASASTRRSDTWSSPRTPSS